MKKYVNKICLPSSLGIGVWFAQLKSGKKKKLWTTQETAISTHTLTQLTHVNAIATFRIHNNDAICYVHPPTHLSSFDIRGLLVMLIYKCAIKEKREIDNRVDAAAARKVFSTQWSKLQTLECPGQMISSFVQNNFTLMFSQNTNMISNI